MQSRQVLILHGWGSSSKNWRFVKELLGQQGCSVYVPDLPGFGVEPPPEHPWSVEDYAEWVNQWMGKSNLQQVVLVGHSFGGGVAAVFAAKHPHKIDRLILVSAAIRRQKTYRQRLFFFISKIGKLIFSLPVLTLLQRPAQRMLYRFIGVQDYITPAVQKSPVMKATFRKVIGQDLTSYLVQINASSLIIWGDKDNVTPLKDANFICQNIKNSKLEIIPQRDHDLNLRGYQELANAILDFIKTA